MLVRIKHIKTPTFYPQSNGSLERAHAVVKDLLRTAIADNRTEWDLNLKIICMAYNTTAHEKTGYASFELTFGRKANLPFTLVTTQSLSHNELGNFLKKGIKIIFKSQEKKFKDQRRKIKVSKIQ